MPLQMPTTKQQRQAAKRGSNKQKKTKRAAKVQRVEILCVVDKSGSMQTTKADAIGGYNEFLKDQRAQPGHALVTLVLFDTEYSVSYEAQPVATAPELSNDNYHPAGGTALLDAVGRAITSTSGRIKAQEMAGRPKPDKVLCAIVTDGGENSSHEYSRHALKLLVGAVEHDGWEFIYIGANQDAFAEAGHMGIKMAANAAAGAQGMATAFKTASLYTQSTRAFAGKMDHAIGADWLQGAYTASLTGQAPPAPPTAVPQTSPEAPKGSKKP